MSPTYKNCAKQIVLLSEKRHGCKGCKRHLKRILRRRRKQRRRKGHHRNKGSHLKKFKCE